MKQKISFRCKLYIIRHKTKRKLLFNLVHFIYIWSMIKHLNNPKNNIIVVIIVEIITLSISFTADYSGVGMTAIILKWIPAIIGVLTLLLYFVSRIFTKKYNWIISIIGIFFMFIAAYNLYIIDYSQTL